VGLASLLATSRPLEPGPLYFYAITQNNYEDDLYRFANQAFACKNEEAVLKWTNFESSNTRLSAEPQENISPNLGNKTLMREGTLNIKVLGEAKLSLDFGGEDDAVLDIGIIPEELCAGFSFPLVGKYEGQFEQTTPNPSTLERQLRLLWTREDETLLLRATVTDSLNSPSFEDTLQCNYSLTAPNLLCEDTEEGKTLRLELNVGQDGLKGSYTGTTPSGLDFGGDIAMQKDISPQATP